MHVLMLKRYYNSCLSTLVTVTMKKCIKLLTDLLPDYGAVIFYQVQPGQTDPDLSWENTAVSRKIVGKKMLKVHATTSKAIVGSFQGTVP